MNKELIDRLRKFLGGELGNDAANAIDLLSNERDALAAELKALREQEPFCADDERFRGAFDASLHQGNWPSARKGYGYRSPMTQMAWQVAFSTFCKLGLYARPVPCQDTADMVNKAFQDGINSGYAQAMEEEIARSRQVDPSTLPERDESKPAESQGLFRKFEVRRVDGSDKPGGKHHGCRYFVLDLDHDQHADAAMAAYAQACKNTHPALSAELEAQYPSEHPTKFFCYSEDIGYLEFGTLDGAITCAESMLSDARDNADLEGEWSEEETSISYGSVIGEAVEIVRGDGGYEYSISRPGNQPPKAGDSILGEQK